MNQIKRHVDNCPRCTEILKPFLNSAGLAEPATGGNTSNRKIPEDLKNLFAPRTTRFRQLLGLTQPEQYQFGQIWTTKSWSEDQRSAREEDILPRLVVLLEDGDDTWVLSDQVLVVAPISVDIAYQGNYDLLLFEQESPLGYPFMVEIWNKISLFRSQLGRCLGTLSQRLNSLLELVHQAYLGLSVNLSEVTQHLGPAIRHPDDPRIHFQEQEIEACDYLRRLVFESLKRIEARESEADWRRPAVLFRKALQVIHNQLPAQPSQRMKDFSLAAAEAGTKVISHYIYTEDLDGEVLGRLEREHKTGSLYLVWEHLPNLLQGTFVSILLQLEGNKEPLTAEESSVHQGGRTLLVREKLLSPAQVKSLTLEFRG